MTPEILEKEEIIVVGVRTVLRLGEGAENGLWSERFLPRQSELVAAGDEYYCVFGQIPGDMDGHFEYVAGVKTDSLENIPTGMVGWIVPAGNYAVADADSRADIPRVCREILTDWLPDSGYRLVNNPMFARASAATCNLESCRWTVHIPIETPEMLAQLETWFA